MLKNNTYWGTSRTGQAIVTTGTLNKSAHEKLASSSLSGWLNVVRERRMRKEWHSRQHHWAQDGLSRQANHEVPVWGEHVQLIFKSNNKFWFPCRGSKVQRCSPSVQGLHFLLGHQTHPVQERAARVTEVQETAFSSQDFLSFFISINTRWPMDKATEMHLGPDGSSLSLCTINTRVTLERKSRAKVHI